MLEVESSEYPSLFKVCPEAFFVIGKFPQYDEHMDWTDLLPPHTSSHATDLLQRLLKVDPSLRITASEALQHPFFS